MKNTMHSGRWVSLVFLLVGLVYAHCKSGQDVEPSDQASARHARGVSTPKEIVGRDGAPMDLVPAGSFIMGSPEGVGRNDEHPEHEVWLDDFYIDRYEVTVGRFEKCVQAWVCTEDSFRTVTDDPACNYGDADRTDHPMNCVDWVGMEEYCDWAGKRLPTEAEWEKAARGTDGRIYPWGNEEPTCEHALMSFDSEKTRCSTLKPPFTQQVGGKFKGVGTYGTHNLGGNVAEWCEDLYLSTFYAVSPQRNPVNRRKGSRRSARGGSSEHSAQETCSTFRISADPLFNSIGGRCVADP